MRKNKLLILLWLPLLLAGCAISPSTVDEDNSQLVIGEAFTLESGKVLTGDLAVVGSSLTLEEGSLVQGEISLIGSTAEISGKVAGDIYAIAGSTTLSSTAVISGDFNQIFHKLNMDPGAAVRGEINTYSTPSAFKPAWSGINILFPYFSNPEKMLTSRLILSAIFCFIACLVVYLLPKPSTNLVRTIKNQPGVSWGVGLLFSLAIPPICLVLAITICLSPLAFILLVVFLLSSLFGWIAIAAIVGEQMNKWFYLKMPFVLQTLVGSLLVAFLVSLTSLIPCIGLLLCLIVGCYGLGGVVISRFGKIEDKGDKNQKAKKPTPDESTKR